jgi:hypothetical protein
MAANSLFQVPINSYDTDVDRPPAERYSSDPMVCGPDGGTALGEARVFRDPVMPEPR